MEPVRAALVVAIAAASCGELACQRASVPRHLVVVSLDAVGAAHVGAYGYPRDTTPEFDAMAKQGTLFEAAYAQQTWTLSSHLTLMTGLPPAVHGASRARPAAPRAVTLAEALARAGFESAAFVAERVWMHPRFGHARGFDRYEIGSSDASAHVPPILDWLREQAGAAATDDAHRFFLFAHFYDAHSDGKAPVPYYVPGPAGTRFLPDGEPWGRAGGTSLLVALRRSGEATARDRKFLTAYYDAGVRWVDEQGLGAILRALRELGLEDETLLVVTADHGEEIFEHGYVLHGQAYVETTHVPLVLRGPGVPRGRRSAGLVGLVDVAPTVLSLLGLPPLEGAQGRDVSRLLFEDASVQDAVFTDGVFESDRDWGSSVVADLDGRRWAYVARVAARGAAGRREFEVEKDGELFDLGADPRQLRDVAAEHPAVAKALARRLLAWYRRNEALALPFAAPPPRALVSEREARHLEQLGYAE